MTLKKLISLTAMVYASISLNAQSKILQTISARATNSATNKVVETADKTVNKALDKILDGNMFKKKAAKVTQSEPAQAQKEQSTDNSTLTGATELSISSIDYSSLGALADVIKINKTVTDVQRSFSNGAGLIQVKHTCKTEELLDDILKNTAGKYEVAEVGKGKITLKLMK